MSPGSLGVALLEPARPLLERQEGEPGLSPEPAVHCLRKSSQRERLRGHGMKGLAEGSHSVFDRTSDPLGDIIGMNVMDRFKPTVGQGELLAARDQREDLGIHVAQRVDGHPSLANDMAWSEARCRKSISPRLLQEPPFDLRLVDTVGIDRVWTVNLRGGDRRCVSISPNGTAEEIVLHLAVQRLD